MNTNVLHGIAKRGLEYLGESRVVKNLNALNAALQNQINSPNAENNAKLSEAVNQIRNNLGSVSVDFFPRTWTSAIEEIGFAPYLPQNLMKQVEAALNRNQLTIVDAQKEIETIQKRLTDFQDTFSKSKESL